MRRLFDVMRRHKNPTDVPMRAILYDLHNGHTIDTDKTQRKLETERFAGFRCPVCGVLGKRLPHVKAKRSPLNSAVSECCNPGCEEHGRRFSAWYDSEAGMFGKPRREQ